MEGRRVSEKWSTGEINQKGEGESEQERKGEKREDEGKKGLGKVEYRRTG